MASSILKTTFLLISPGNLFANGEPILKVFLGKESTIYILGKFLFMPSKAEIRGAPDTLGDGSGDEEEEEE